MSTDAVKYDPPKVTLSYVSVLVFLRSVRVVMKMRLLATSFPSVFSLPLSRFELNLIVGGFCFKKNNLSRNSIFS